MDNIFDQGRIYVTFVSKYVPDLKDQTEFPIFVCFLSQIIKAWGKCSISFYLQEMFSHFIVDAF